MSDFNQVDFVDRLELYFERAVTAWLLLKDEAGLIAALAAAKTFNSADRQIIVTILDNLAEDWHRQDNENLFAGAIKSLMDLKDIITSKDWTVEDGIAERERLKMVDPEYEQALVNGDPDVFVRKHPNQFG